MAFRRSSFGAVLLMLLAPSLAMAAEPGPSGATLGRNCLICHAKDYHDVNPIPRLSGFSAADIAAALRDYRAGRRQATIMDRIASGYSDAEIDRIAAFLSSLTWGDQ